MKKRPLLHKILLLPLSKIYGMVTSVRNKMFDLGILKQREFDVPVIVVGNLAVGGTGKTPHTEFIISSLRHGYYIGVLSRGYKRGTKGFVLAKRESSPQDIGDEPYQIYRKYGHDVTVAVCEDRCKGINEMLRLDPDINLVILDDAFQHRYVKPAVSIVITEYARPLYLDSMLPYGRLRESVKGLNRADIIIVSKCPEGLSPIQYSLFAKNLMLFPYQKLYFSKFAYGSLVPVFQEKAADVPELSWLSNHDAVLAVCGIGNPRPFIKFLKNFEARVKVNLFPDHHNYTRRDIETVVRRFDDMKGSRKMIVTTEKDAVRLVGNPYIPDRIKSHIYYLPIKVEFDRNEGNAFIDAVQKAIK